LSGPMGTVSLLIGGTLLAMSATNGISLIPGAIFLILGIILLIMDLCSTNSMLNKLMGWIGNLGQTYTDKLNQEMEWDI